MMLNNVSAASTGRSLIDWIDCSSLIVSAFRWYMLAATIRASNSVVNSEYSARRTSEPAVWKTRSYNSFYIYLLTDKMSNACNFMLYSSVNRCTKCHQPIKIITPWANAMPVFNASMCNFYENVAEIVLKYFTLIITQNGIDDLTSAHGGWKINLNLCILPAAVQSVLVAVVQSCRTLEAHVAELLLSLAWL